ncbi:hypothetical protein FRC12_003510 [Ceratobasidium sp. 428]|nr:hypothetical protein FRC12_003510 [Ceratobasidium sp. 428]
MATLVNTRLRRMGGGLGFRLALPAHGSSASRFFVPASAAINVIFFATARDRMTSPAPPKSGRRAAGQLRRRSRSTKSDFRATSNDREQRRSSSPPSASR